MKIKDSKNWGINYYESINESTSKDKESSEDKYHTGAGSPGVSSSGISSMQGNSNKGLKPLPEGFIEERIKMIKKLLG